MCPHSCVHVPCAVSIRLHVCAQQGLLKFCKGMHLSFAPMVNAVIKSILMVTKHFPVQVVSLHGICFLFKMFFTKHVFIGGKLKSQLINGK